MRKRIWRYLDYGKKEIRIRGRTKKCRAVADAFAGLEEENILVVDVGRFGFLRLLYYKYPDGFDDAISYFDS